MVGATTRTGMISAPLRDRFGMVERLRFYNEKELTQIVTRTAGILSIEIEDAAAVEIARRCRATPRIANRLINRVRDFAQVRGDGIITMEITESRSNYYESL